MVWGRGLPGGDDDESVHSKGGEFGRSIRQLGASMVLSQLSFFPVSSCEWCIAQKPTAVSPTKQPRLVLVLRMTIQPVPTLESSRAFSPEIQTIVGQKVFSHAENQRLF
jgi:hypothetical protein